MLSRALQLMARGDYPNAIGLLQQSVIAQPKHFEPRIQLAKAYLDWVHIQAKMPLTEIEPSMLSEGLAHYLNLAESMLLSLVKTHPSSPHVQGLLAMLHLVYKRPAEALDCLKKALAKDPLNPEYIYNMGYSLMEMKRYAEAEKQFTRLIKMHPGHGMGWHMLAEAKRLGGNPGDSMEAYRHAMQLLPDWPQPYGGLGTALMTLDRHEEWLPYLEKAVSLDPNLLLNHTSLLFNLHFHPGLSATEVSSRHRATGAHFEEQLKSALRPHDNLPDPERKLRIGFISGDLRAHPVGYFMHDLLASLKTGNLELVAYSNGAKHDKLTERIKPQFALWRESGMINDDNLAEQIRADSIDILVDLSGYTEGNRLLVFARKPAPIQVTYLGYFDTTGLAAMDYILGNRWLLPENEESLYTEKPWRLPDAHLCFTPPDLPIEVSSLPALQSGHITFGCFNKAEKVNARVIACWSKILHAVPGSRLYLKYKNFGNSSMVEHYRALFAEHGIAPERLIMEGNSEFTEYLKSYNRVDLALDPYPYNGGTTTVQSLWMGVPTLTLQGDRYAAHMGESILHTVNMPEWIAADEENYIDKAIAFASDLSTLSELRSGLRKRLLASPICDAPAFSRKLEDAFRGMWRAWCNRT